MEFKNINNYRMKWFGHDEIRNLEEVKDKLPSLQKFSFGPFVPYYLYLFFHNIWDYYILQLAVNMAMGYIALIGYYLFYFYAIFKGAFSAIQNFESEATDFSELFPQLLGSYINTFVVVLVVFVVLFVAVDFGIKIYAGKHCRILSWNRCEWKSFEEFEQGEKNWHIVGLIFFILKVLSLVFAIILIGVGMFLLKTYLPSLKDILPTGLQS